MFLERSRKGTRIRTAALLENQGGPTTSTPIANFPLVVEPTIFQSVAAGQVGVGRGVSCLEHEESARTVVPMREQPRQYAGRTTAPS